MEKSEEIEVIKRKMAHIESRGLVTIIGIIIVVAVIIWVLREVRNREDDSREDARERRGRRGSGRDGLDRDLAAKIGGWVLLIVVILVVVYFVSAAVKGLNLAGWMERHEGAAAARSVAAEYGSKHGRRYNY